MLYLVLMFKKLIVISFFKKNSQTNFNILIDIVVYDMLNQKERFLVVYSLLSQLFNKRIFICTKINQTLSIISVSSIFFTANWIEREIWDFFGIFFLLHNDLRRILTDYGFDFYPLRKDFPLIGLFEMIYDETQKRIISKNFINLAQEYRFFNIDFN